MVVADRADARGVIANVYQGGRGLVADPVLKRWHDGMKAGGEAATASVMEIITPQGKWMLLPAMTDQETQFDIWRDTTAVVAVHNQPGTF